MEENSCVIYGHDKFIYTSRIRKLVFSDFEELIVKYNVVHFLKVGKMIFANLPSKFWLICKANIHK